MVKPAGFVFIIFVAAMFYGASARSQDCGQQAWDACLKTCLGDGNEACLRRMGCKRPSAACIAKSMVAPPKPSGMGAPPSGMGDLNKLMKTTTDKCLGNGGETREEAKCDSGVACFTNAGGVLFLECITKGD